MLHWKKKWSHFDLKSWVTGWTKIRPGIPSTWIIFESNWFDIESQIVNTLQLLGIPTRILVPPVTQLFMSKWLNFSFSASYLAHLANFRLLVVNWILKFTPHEFFTKFWMELGLGLKSLHFLMVRPLQERVSKRTLTWSSGYSSGAPSVWARPSGVRERVFCVPSSMLTRSDRYKCSYSALYSS